MRQDITTPWWQQDIIGFEGETGDGGTGTPPAGTPPAGDPPSGGDGDKGAAGDSGTEPPADQGSDGDDDDLPKDLSGLKSAIVKERAAYKKAAKDLKAAQKIIDDAKSQDLSAVDKAEKAATASAEKVTRLASTLRKTALDSAIEREARELKFKDVDDALALTDRSAIGVEQDDDDPADIQIDKKTVKAAVKALAEKKKHLIGGDDDAGDPSGSKFGGGNKDRNQVNAEALKKKYPSLS